MMLYEALEKSMNHDHSEELAKDLAEAHKKKKKRRDSPKTPPGSPPHLPPPRLPPAGPSGASGSLGASGSSQVLPPPPPPPLSTNQEAQSLDDEDIRNARIPKNNWASALAFICSPPLEDSLLSQTGDIAMFIDWFCKRQGITKLKPQDLEGPAFEVVKVFHPNVIHLQYQMEECHKLLTASVDDSILRHNVNKPLPLGGPPARVTIQSDFFFNKDLEYLRYGSKGSRHALSISKMKGAYYPDVGLEQMVPDQMWIEEECKYDIATIAVRTHMRILSVVRIEVFSMCGYDYMNKIVLRRADLNEHIIAERDFKYLYPSNFEDLYLLNLQEDFQLGIESYQTQLNLTKPRWDATGFEYKHDYTVINSPRAVTFWDRYGVQMIMRFNDIHKFSDGTLQQIDEAIDYRVKEFKVAVCSSLRSLKPKHTIESRAKRSSQIILLGHYSIMLASSHTVKMGFNSLIHSFRVWSTLRRFGLRMASAAAKPCQGDSLEFYLIIGSIYTDQWGTVVVATLFNESEQRDFRPFITNVYLQESRRLQLLAKEMSFHNSILTLQTHYHRHDDS
nr:hypothetical protein [Tanacetum cinerariifolium]